MVVALRDRHRGAGKALGRNLRQLRAARGLTIREMARWLRLSPATLGRIELDKGCTLPVLITIYRRTGQKFELLLGLKKRGKLPH